ncbi:MAG: hypothetical protein QNJ91_00865 [Gammaproteobacteria bacterium]|nr:hypothetical protein [Gammaproteobacteria bacterium]
MRWFVIFLLIANIALFFWVQQSSLNPASHSELPPPEIGQLQLRNEPPPGDAQVPAVGVSDDGSAAAPADAAPAAADPVPATAEAAAPPAAVSAPPPPAVIVPPAPPAVTSPPVPARPQPTAPAQTPPPPLPDPPRPAPPQPTPPSAAPPAAVSDSVDDSVPASPLAGDAATTVQADAPPTATAAVPASPAAGAADPPVVAAATDSDPGNTAPTAAAPEPAPGPTPAVATCSRVGPLAGDAADALRKRLPAAIEVLADSTEDTSQVDGYYVLVPALPTRAEGLQMLQKLGEAGFEDTWLFRRGAYRNAISLGLFRREAGARRHAERVAAKGFAVEVRERTSRVERRSLLLRHRGDLTATIGELPDGASVATAPCPSD